MLTSVSGFYTAAVIISSDKLIQLHLNLIYFPDLRCVDDTAAGHNHTDICKFILYRSAYFSTFSRFYAACYISYSGYFGIYLCDRMQRKGI